MEVCWKCWHGSVI